jgi:2-polyprenyl-3-methyl-5-hydroxy-6-metoxy-1,4-benzoquinol methylase
MQERHQNREKYFEEQGITTEKHVIPYLSGLLKFTPQTEVLEIGCAEAGNLKPFLDIGCKATGIDMSCSRIELAKKMFASHPKKNNLVLICEDIYKTDLQGKMFDLIIMRDVIEHIPNQERFMNVVKKFMKPGGKFFLGFPPWQNPFGGHQQVCRNKLLSKLPWIHLLPAGIYRFILNAMEKNRKRTEELMEIRKTGISIDRFEKILKKENYTIDKRTLFLINPNYQTKFGLKPRKQARFIGAIPWLRNFLTTAVYYVISKNTAV